jgi:hypothetical protein
MKKPFRAIALGVVCCSVGVLTGAVVAYAVSGTPEIDRASATIQASGNLTSVTCTGEDNTGYVTLSGAFNGGENQMLPDATDYVLSGKLKITAIVWTVNTQTARGVLTAKITLLNSAAAGATYAGKLTLVTQGVPAAGAVVTARGFIVANFKLKDDGVAPPNDDNLIANVEGTLSPTGMSLDFGDAVPNPGYPDFAAVTNVAPTAADGTC